jgi:hypothetical protein
MLKQLIQLFAEKFLTSKKEWVAEQLSFISANYTEIPINPDGELHTFTMPYTGIAVLRGYGVMFANLEGLSLVNLGAGANGNICVNLFAKKGTVLKYEVGKSSGFSSASLLVYKVYGSP